MKPEKQENSKMKKIPRNEFAVLNVGESKETYRRIEDGTQKVVFEYPVLYLGDRIN